MQHIEFGYAHLENLKKEILGFMEEKKEILDFMDVIKDLKKEMKRIRDGEDKLIEKLLKPPKIPTKFKLPPKIPPSSNIESIVLLVLKFPMVYADLIKAILLKIPEPEVDLPEKVQEILQKLVNENKIKVSHPKDGLPTYSPI